MYAVVKFPGGNGVNVVPQTRCDPAMILCLCDTYEKAVKMCKLAEGFSDKKTKDESRVCKRERRYRSSHELTSSEEEEELAPPRPKMARPSRQPAPVEPNSSSPFPPLVTGVMTAGHPAPEAWVSPDVPLTPHSSSASPGLPSADSQKKTIEEVAERAADRIMGRMVKLFGDQLDALQQSVAMLRNEVRAAYAIRETDSAISNHPFPMTSEAEVNELEEKLMDPQFSQSLTSYLGSIGGSTAKKVVTNMMERLMRKELALKFNFVGRNGKRPFSALRLLPIVKKAAKNNQVDGITETVVADHIKVWLRTAKDREGGRMERYGHQIARAAQTTTASPELNDSE